MWNLQWGLVAIAKSSSRGNQSWESLVTHSSTSRWALLMMHRCQENETQIEILETLECVLGLKYTEMQV